MIAWVNNMSCEYNDSLAFLRPDLAAEWHPIKNGILAPKDVTPGSNKKAWWIYPYDDPNTGKHFDFEWEASVQSRVRGNGCPYLPAGKKAWPGFNDLATLNPALAAEWHPERNGEFKPTDVRPASMKKAWWLLPYDDPDSGMHFDFEWEAIINNRNKGAGCPYLSGDAVWPGFNDLATKAPEIAKQWHPTRNGDLSPADVTANSNKKVWWFLPYDDPITGQHFDFEWEAIINDRVNKNSSCPYLTGKAVCKGFNDLATRYPELAKQWHPINNYPLTPMDVTAGSRKKVWWLLPYDDPDTGKHFDFEWESAIYSRTSSKECGCPYLSGKAVWKGFNDLATRCPELAKQWHPTKNGDLTPDDVTIWSKKKVWWIYPYDDPNTGKHFDFQWDVAVSNRVAGNGCPFLSGDAVWPGFNDLATLNPELAAEWHPIKNNDLTTNDVSPGSHKKVWWILPYDDPETGNHFDFEWEATIHNRNNGNGCPYLEGRAAWAGYNDLATKSPELALRWNKEKNRQLTPDKTVFKSEKKVWWICLNCGHTWRQSPYARSRGACCPKCKHW